MQAQIQSLLAARRVVGGQVVVAKEGFQLQY